MAEETVCLDLMALYKSKVGKYKQEGFPGTFPGTYEWDCVDTDCHVIRREKSPDGSDYYDLYRNCDSGLRLCCDGEQCVVTERTGEYINLVSVDNLDNEELCGIDTIFSLAPEEFEIATGGRK